MTQIASLSIVIWFASISLIRGDICDICVCSKRNCEPAKDDSASACFDQFEEYFSCDGLEPHPPLDLNSIQWPNRNGSVSATFNNFKLTYLTNVLCSASVPSVASTLSAINLEGNSIEHIVNDPFQYCKNLTSISIANNQIERLPSELFESTHSLQRLNISHNALSEFDGRILSRCKHIISLDLSHNQITILKVNEILDASPNIETISAADNLLFAISDNNQNKYLRLKSLNLSGNKMTVITQNTFHSYPSLQYLNISSNVLGNIEQNAFQELDVLQILDLSMNNLKDLSLKLPESLEHISLARNRLKYWPIAKPPRNLKIMELQENLLTEMFNVASGKDRMEFTSLVIVNISRNHINSLPFSLSFPELEVFDASYNEFSSIPQYLGAQAPVLNVLLLRGNPIKTIEFTTKITAHVLDFSELPLLTEFDANVFNSLEPKNGCIELIISHNGALQKIRNSFERVPNLCRLDLSYNNLKLIDHNWMNWTALDRGANLQGNPIDCTCASQWMLDYFVPMIYNEPKNHHYLYELRCASPERFKGRRLVHYFNHSEEFCRPEVAQSRFGLHRESDDDYELLWYQGFGLWLTIALIIIIVSSSLSIIFILGRRYYRQRQIKRNNRRFHNGGIL